MTVAIPTKTTETLSTDPELQPELADGARAHIEAAIAECEKELERLPSFRALQQLEARCNLGDAPTAIDQQHLRDRLTESLKAEFPWRMRESLTAALSALETDEPRPNLQTDTPFLAKLTAQAPTVTAPTSAEADQPQQQATATPLRSGNEAEEKHAPTITVVANDLSQICGIDTHLREQLATCGLTQLGQIANLTAVDVADLSRKLDLGRRIQRQNWIEQAAVLAAGQPTRFVRHGMPVTIAAPRPPLEEQAPETRLLSEIPEEEFANTYPFAGHSSQQRRFAPRKYDITQRRPRKTYFTIPYDTEDAEEAAFEPVEDAASAPAPQPEQTCDQGEMPIPQRAHSSRTWGIEKEQPEAGPIHTRAGKRTYFASAADTASTPPADRFHNALSASAPAPTDEATITIRTYQTDVPEEEAPSPLSYRLSEGQPEYALDQEDYFEAETLPPRSGYGAYHVEVEEASVEFHAKTEDLAGHASEAEENRNLFIRRSHPAGASPQTHRIKRFFKALSGGEDTRSRND